MTHRLIIGITGASGVIYGIKLLQFLKAQCVETHLIISEAGKKNIEIETRFKLHEVTAMAGYAYDIRNFDAPLASGSFLTEGMVIIPCTIKTLSGIANCYSNNLMVRAADVTLKEKRRLILGVRETPLSRGHLRLMSLAAEMGALIVPPMPAFYHQPETIDDIIHQTIGKILDCLGFKHNLFRRWGEKKE